MFFKVNFLQCMCIIKSQLQCITTLKNDALGLCWRMSQPYTLKNDDIEEGRSSQLQHFAALWPAAIRGGSIKVMLAPRTYRKDLQINQHPLYHISQALQYRGDGSLPCACPAPSRRDSNRALFIAEIHIINSWWHYRPYAKVSTPFMIGREDWTSGFSTGKTPLNGCRCELQCIDNRFCARLSSFTWD